RWTAQEAAAELDDEGRTAIRDNLLRQKQRLVYRSWFEALLKQAIADGRVEASDAWNVYLDQARRIFVEAGGKLGPVKTVKADEAQDT
ncbi:MAG: hypothetical protein QF464_07795, partial [Myxococcota bacterium]|nr:hypothetical protein [Myxococcota bacterium]